MAKKKATQAQNISSPVKQAPRRSSDRVELPVSVLDELTKLPNNLANVTEQVDRLQDKVADIVAGLARVEGRLNGVDEKVSRMQSTVFNGEGSLVSRVSVLETQSKNLDRRQSFIIGFGASLIATILTLVAQHFVFGGGSSSVKNPPRSTYNAIYEGH